MKNLFLSLVGTQAMGTLQPWLAFAREYPGSPACLLTTKFEKVRSVAERLCDVARDRNLGEVTLVSIPDGLDGEKSAPAVMRELAEKVQNQGGRVFYNVDGGMNYMIAACVLALEPYAPVLIQASQSRIVVHDTATSETAQWPLPDALPVRTLFELQGKSPVIDDPNNTDETNNLVLRFCRRGNVSLPNTCVSRVHVDNICFDLVWNPGNNRLHFLKDNRFPPTQDKERKIMERSLAHFATDRERSAQLYDRSISVLVQNGKSEERLLKESDGKINVINVNGWQEESSLMRAPLVKLLDRKAHPIKKQIFSPPAACTDAPLADNTLVVCVGTNLPPTLRAIWSHQPRHLVLCYTEKTPAIKADAKHLARLAEDQGISVRLASVSIEGRFDPLLPPPEKGAHVHVNITPGSKGQGAMLILWAKQHNCAIWSLDTGSGCCVPLFAPHGEQPLPFRSCDPAVQFWAEGLDLLEDGLSETDLTPDMPLMEGLLSFMRAALKEGKEKEVMRSSVTAGGMTLHEPKPERWELCVDGQACGFDLRGGEWFEKLAGVAFLRAGADHVRVRMRLPWNEKNERKIFEKHNIHERPHRLDLDVVATWNGDTILVSCKSSPKETVKPAAQEALHTGANLGRFSLRMLAHMGVEKAYIREGVMVLGWRELCQPEVLRDLVDQLRETKRTLGKKGKK